MNLFGREDGRKLKPYQLKICKLYDMLKLNIIFSKFGCGIFLMIIGSILFIIATLYTIAIINYLFFYNNNLLFTERFLSIIFPFLGMCVICILFFIIGIVLIKKYLNE